MLRQPGAGFAVVVVAVIPEVVIPVVSRVPTTTAQMDDLPGRRVANMPDAVEVHRRGHAPRDPGEGGQE